MTGFGSLLDVSAWRFVMGCRVCVGIVAGVRNLSYFVFDLQF